MIKKYILNGFKIFSTLNDDEVQIHLDVNQIEATGSMDAEALYMYKDPIRNEKEKEICGISHSRDRNSDGIIAM